MITFKNIAGNKFLAVGTIQRKSALNGEKSLTGNLYDGKDVLNKIDKGWSLEFDGEPYVVTYFERNDNDNSVSFDAIHKFFWDMAKKVLYSSTEISGSHTIKWYLDQIFANTGYTYALNFSPAAIEKDNWGNKTRLSLFNDLITSIAGEFEINGTLISIFQNIGTDLSTIVRYGFNLSDMTLENDATSFVTYGEGFGAYADQENQTGDRVHVTYTSPLAGVYGILQAEPIDDQRYTSQANLQAAVKAQVDASFSVSVQLSLYDLTAAGYPYKMANVGDWLTAVDENLDFKQRIRIISIDDEFSADGTRISYTVTAGDIGLTKKYQDANASMASQIANAVASASQASTDANFALIAANGKLTAYYVGSYDELPTTANEGDLGWVTSGDGRLLYIYTKKADGSYYWEKRIDPEMGDQIAAGVTEAVAQANAHTEEVKQGLSSDIATAKSQASSQASTAEANAKSAATSQFNQAQSALSAAKTDLTNSIASEASARNAAVAAANSQAQTYANQAKEDAMSAASSADGVIRTSISSSANSLSATITQNKSSADSGISTAQTTAQQAVDGLKFKVSQTDYNTKTGQLQTDLTSTTQTANQAKTDIVSIKQKDGDQDSRMTQIESDASGVKTTVSDLQTTTGKQSGDISTLQQRADGFDATVTKVNNLQVGGRNYYILSTSVLGWLSNGNIVSGAQDITSDFIKVISTSLIISIFSSGSAAYGNDNLAFYDENKVFISQTTVFGNYPPDNSHLPDPNYKIINLPNNVAYVRYQGAINATYKVEFGTLPTDWYPAPEDVDSATAKAQLTADQATLSINNYKTDADGRISKAQADIIVNANAITQKVSQSDYNAKTGDLTTKVNTAQSTADSATSTIGAYKTSNDARVASAESKITANANAITQKVSQTDYNQKTGELSGKISEISQTAGQISQSVSNVQAQVNNLSVGGRNLYPNSRKLADGFGVNGGVTATVEPFDSTTNMWHLVAAQGSGTNVGIYNWNSASEIIPNGSDWAYSADIKGTGVPNIFGIESGNKNPIKGTVGSTWSRISQTGHVNDDIKSIVMYFDTTNSPLDVYIKLPKLETGTIPTDWSPAPEDTATALAQVKITADGISNFVRDSSGNISYEFQNALSKTSIITGSTLATSIQTQTSSQITQALTDNNGNIISLINQDTSGVQIAGKNIVLDGNTTVTGDFYAKGGNFKNLNASNLTVGTLNGSQVNITNINANNIVSGAISGANLNINLNTGSVVFQKGRINSSDYTTDINIDQGYISTSDEITRALLTQGKLQLIESTLISPQTNPYLEISNNSSLFNGMAALIKARDSLTVSINGYSDRGYDTQMSTEKFVGLSIGKYNNKLMPTKIGGAEQGVIISGGNQYNDIVGTDTPYIFVGSDSNGTSPNGNRVYINAKAVHIPSAYNVTWSTSANVYIASDGSLYRASSAKKYKQDIKHNVPLSDSKKLLEIPLSTWIDKRQYREKNDETRYFGMIAEDLRDAGLEYLVQYGDDNEVEGINYDRVALLLIPLVKELKERIEELESEGK